MISFLMLIICILSVISRNHAALAYALFAVAHDQFELIGWQYYLSAGFADVAVLGIIAMSIKPSRTTTGILYVSFLSMFMNFYGFLLWVNYLEPTTYNVSFYFIYLLAIVIIIRGDSAKLQRFGGCSFVSIVANKGSFFSRSLSQEKGN